MRTFKVSAQTEWQYPLRYNIAPTQEIPVVRQVSSERKLSLMKWGLVPSWANDMKMAGGMINARSETAAEKPAFRSAMTKRRLRVEEAGQSHAAVFVPPTR
jgi:putative SOS response-associated peptidase YedK